LRPPPPTLPRAAADRPLPLPPPPPQDPHLVPMLKMYKRSGRKLFLATNSLWDYTVRAGPDPGARALL
jgi:hypothetical protein